MSMTFWKTISVLTLVIGIVLDSAAKDQSIPITEPDESCVSTVHHATGVTATRYSGNALDEIIYFEDWEGGDMGGWVGIDLTAAPSAWHRDDYMAYGGTGMSWWMADSTIAPNGGYADHWYMVLDSPPIQLGATPTLRFWHRWQVEDSTGARQVQDYPPNTFTGWDGVNIRISVDGGGTWTVIPGNMLTPTYTSASLYSFGHEHGEGPGIPGWCDDNPGVNWHQVTANLAQWANQNVKIRWAFASDPAASTTPQTPWFGWMVDAIRVYNGANDTVFTSDADADDGFTHQSLTGDPAGQLWRMVTDNTSPEGSHVLVCNDPQTNMYRPNMNNVLESPLIPLGDIGFGTLTATFSFRGTVIGTSETFPDCDFIGFQVSADSGGSWCYMSNPDCDPADTNYVYILGDQPVLWQNFAEYFGEIEPIPYRNQALKFRITFESNGSIQAAGLFVDGFQLEYLAGFPHDVSCIALQVRYPTMQNRPIRIKGYFRNEGSDPATDVQTWYQVDALAPVAFMPVVDFEASGEVETRQANVTITNAGPHSMLARSQFLSDLNPDNDTSYATNIMVQPTSQELELGYDNRTVQYRFQYETGEGALVRFTPVTDTIVTGDFDVTTIRAQFDAGQDFYNMGDLPIRLKIYRGTPQQPAILLYDEEIVVQETETGEGNWKDIDVSEDPDLLDIDHDFWVWFQVVNTTPVDSNRYPMVLGDDAQPWSDIHNYTWSGAGVPPAANFFYQIHAVIDAGVGVGDLPIELPATWSLEQNYPNPFNPATEIRYSVPKAERLTLKVFNLVGQEVATLVDGTVEAGNHVSVFDASNLPSGVYMYRLEAASFSATHKMLLLK